MSRSAPPDARRRILFVVPSTLSSGEAVSVVQMATTLQRAGSEVRCVASGFAARFLAPRLGAVVQSFGDDPSSNAHLWQSAVSTWRPDVVVFADYPLLSFSNGVVRIAGDDWLAAPREAGAVLATLDHVGYAQRELCVCFGPPHLSIHSECTPQPSADMHILLPCPMNDPTARSGRRGVRMRVHDADVMTRERRVAGRSAAGSCAFLAVHLVSNWAWRIAEDWSLPHYRFLTRALRELFGDVHGGVSVVSVNNGDLLEECVTPSLRVRNSGVLAPDDFAALLDAADVVITDNAISASVGRAICAGTPVLLLRNRRRLLEIVTTGDARARALALDMEEEMRGAVFPFEVFPIWQQRELDSLGLLRANPVSECVIPIELFGGEASSALAHALLTNETMRDSLRARQRSYASAVASLPDASEVIRRLVVPGQRPDA